MLQNTPGASKAKIEDLKRDIFSKINTYKKSLIQRRALKNNLETIENKEKENILANQMKKNNEVIKNISDGNEGIFVKNVDYNIKQKNQLDKNAIILNEGDNKYIGVDILNMDNEIQNFLNNVNGLILKLFIVFLILILSL